jgi:hypothetical protein
MTVNRNLNQTMDKVPERKFERRIRVVNESVRRLKD